MFWDIGRQVYSGGLGFLTILKKVINGFLQTMAYFKEEDRD